MCRFVFTPCVLQTHRGSVKEHVARWLRICWKKPPTPQLPSLRASEAGGISLDLLSPGEIGSDSALDLLLSGKLSLMTWLGGVTAFQCHWKVSTVAVPVTLSCSLLKLCNCSSLGLKLQICASDDPGPWVSLCLQGKPSRKIWCGMIGNCACVIANASETSQAPCCCHPCLTRTSALLSLSCAQLPLPRAVKWLLQMWKKGMKSLSYIKLLLEGNSKLDCVGSWKTKRFNTLQIAVNRKVLTFSKGVHTFETAS